MSIEGRLESVEKELSRVKDALEQAQVSLSVKEIRVQHMVLEDQNGEVRVGLIMTKDGPALVLYAENGQACAQLSATRDASGLILYGENGEVRAWLGLVKSSPSLTMTDENGKARAGLAVLKDGPRLTMLDENGNVIWTSKKDTGRPDGGK